MIKIYLLLISLNLPAILAVSAQNLKFTRYTSENGLPQNTVFSIVQDSLGFIWFGTADGLARFDGKYFKNFRNDISDSTSLPDNLVATANLDSQGKLILSSFKNISVYNQSFENFNQIPIQDLKTLYSVNSESALILDKQGIKKYDFISKQLTPIDIDEPIENIVDIFSISDSVTLLVKTTSISICRKSKIKKLLIPKFSVIPYSSKHIFLNDSILVVGVMSKLGNGEFFKINIKQMSAEKWMEINCKTDEQTDNILTSLASENNRFLWLSVHHFGLMKIDLENASVQQTILKNENGLTTNLIIKLYIDRSKNLWVGTDVSGLFKADLKPEEFTLIKTSEKYKIDNLTKAIYSAGDQFIWLGSFSPSNGLIRFNKQTKEVKEFRNLSDNKIISLKSAGNHHLWITTDRALDLFDIHSQTVKSLLFSHESSLSYNKCVFVGKDKSGKDWFVAHDGICYLEQKQNKFQYPESITPKLFNELKFWNLSGIFYSDSTIYFTSSFGIGEVNTLTEKVNFIDHISGIKASISEFRPRVLLMDNQKRLWIGTENGIIVWDRKNNQSFLVTEKEGLPNNFIYGLIKDNHNFLWISTNKGLSRFDLNTKLPINQNHQSGNQAFQNYDESDGLQANEFNSCAYFKDQNGILYFGGIGGVNYFNPDSINNNPFEPKMVLTDFKLFNQSYISDSSAAVKKNWILNYDENTISFDFAALEFTNSEKNKFLYRLENFETDWNLTQRQHDIRYTNLFPGHYILQIKGSNNDGVWAKQSLSVHITIVPPFWRTAWFISAMILFFLSFVYAGIWLVTNQKVKRKITELKRKEELEREREKERNRISRDMHDEVGSGLTKIALLSKSILADSQSTGSKIEEIKKVNETASHLVDNIGEIIWAIDPKNDTTENLAGYLRKYAAEYFDRSNIEVKFYFDDSLPDLYLSPEIRRNIFLTFKEALTNIVKHAKSKKVHICFKNEYGKIAISIKDDGIGFSYSNVRKFGNGLSNMKKRVEESGGYFEIKSSSETGTEVSIQLDQKILHSAH